MGLPVIESTDAPNRKSTPYKMTLDNPFRGKADKNGDEDWVAIDVTKDTIYAFTLTSDDPDDTDPRLTLLDSNGQFIESAQFYYYYKYYDDGDQSSQIVYKFDADQTVFLEAEQRSFASRGSYELTAEVVPAPSDPLPGDDTTTRVLDQNQAVTSTLSYNNDVDWFAVSLSQGDIVEFELLDDEGKPVGHATVRLVDADGTTIETGAAGNFYYGSGASSFNHTSRIDADLFVSVESNGFLGNYSLSMKKIDTPANDIAGNRETEASLEVGDRVQSRLSPEGDTDWFALDLEAGRSYVFKATENSEADSPLFAPMIYLLDADGKEIAAADYDYRTDETTIEYDPETDQTLYLAVEGSYYDGYYYYNYGDSTGSYVVFMAENPTEDADAADDETTTYALSSGAEFRGNIGAAGDEDWLAVDLRADTHYEFGAQSRSENNGLFDPVLTLHDADGNVVTQTDDARDLNDPSFVFAIDQGGRYYISVRSSDDFAGDTGRYLVTLDEKSTGSFRLIGSDGNDYLNAAMISTNYLSGEGGSDLLIGDDARNFLDGGTGGDLIKGGGGRDALSGDSGRDVMRGNSGADRLDGGRGNDRLFGGTRGDKLDGGGGDNVLVGGKGADTFILSRGKAVARDFDIGEDILRLDDRLFGGRDLTADEVMTRFGSTDGTDTVLTFKTGAQITLLGVNDLGTLADITDIV